MERSRRRQRVSVALLVDQKRDQQRERAGELADRAGRTQPTSGAFTIA